MNYTVQEIAALTNSNVIGNQNLRIQSIAFDSRIIFSVHETAFIAINTKKNSGDKFISSAVDKGIKVIISEKYYDGYNGITWIIVENSLLFLQNLAHKHLSCFPELQTIGITGSNGKTIVKEWIYQSVSQEISSVKSPKSFNSQIGLPISLFEINQTHELGIFEVGISKPCEMSVLEQIFSPKIGVLTHIGTAHSANFISEEELITEKLLLFRNSEIIIYNGDNLNVDRLIKKLYSSKTLLSFGLKDSNHLHIKSLWTDKSSDLIISYLGETFVLPVQQRDEATLSNALAVIAVLKVLHYSNDAIVHKINQLKSVEMRLESINGLRNNLIINDSFNLDVDSLKIAFQFSKEYKKKNKVLIISDIIDQKESSGDFYPSICKLINDQDFDLVILIGKKIINYQSYIHCKSYIYHNTTEFIDSQQFNSLENSLIILKGARIYEFERIKNELELQKHDTVLEINLNAILHNINVHKSLLKPSTKMMAMVKAYSYGLGGHEIAEFLQHHHIDYLGVAYVDEGIDLRKNGITTPIIVMNPEQNSYGAIIDYNLEPEIYSIRVLNSFLNTLVSKGINHEYPIHIKLETGMHRLGFKEDEINDLITIISSSRIRVASIFSHLSSTDVPSEQEYTLSQIKKFEQLSTQIINGLGYEPIRHILNSSGITNYTEYQFDMVRIGIGMVGVSSHNEIKKQLQNAVVFKTVISQISEIKRGESVGYSRKHIAEKDTKIATIPVGYADGIPRLIGNKRGFCGVKKQLVPIVGNICMDMMMIEIDHIDLKEGDEVIIFNSNPSLEDFAGYCQTIPYEVLTSISRRVKRIYIKD